MPSFLLPFLWSLGLAANAGPAAAPVSPVGSASLTVDQFQVQTKYSFEWVYTVGAGGFGEGDELVVHDPVFHGMRWSKWGDLSPYADKCTAQEPGQNASWGLVTAWAARDGVAVEGVVVDLSRSNCSGGPNTCRSATDENAATEVWLASGALQEGDELRLRIGDTETCTESATCALCGFEMPDRAFPEVAWLADECFDGSCVALDPPLLTIEAASTVRAMWVTAPAQVVAGEPFHVKAALLDQWGNNVASDPVTLSVDLGGAKGAGDGEQWTMAPADQGWHDFEVRLDEPGVVRIDIASSGARQGRSPPIEVVAALPEYRVYWGDIHVHHGYSWVDEDGYNWDVNHLYGRDVAGLDFAGESQKALGPGGEDGPVIDSVALWSELQETCAAMSVDDDYIVMLGFEWMGSYAADAYGTVTEGHHNVYFNRCEAPQASHDLSVIDTVDGENGLWQWIDAQRAAYPGLDGVSAPHAMKYTGNNFDVSYPGTQTLAEIYSEWGDDTVWTDSDAGSTQAMLRKGLRLGWFAASDNHDGWMGNPFGSKNADGGLGAFLATGLSRDALFDAMKARRTYATTGFRGLLHFTMLDGTATVQQGAEYVAQAPTLSWAWYGTADILALRIFSIVPAAIGERTELLLVEEPGSSDHSGSLDLGWDGASDMAYWFEVEQTDGEKAWSSPIYVTADCARVGEHTADPLGLCDGWVEPTDSGGGDGGTDSGPETVDTGTSPTTRCSGCVSSGAWVLVFIPLAGRRARRLPRS